LRSGRLLESADKSREETIREAMQEQDLRSPAQRKLKAHLAEGFVRGKEILHALRSLAGLGFERATKFGGLDR